MLEHGVEVDHATIYRWVQAYGSKLDKRTRSHLNSTNDSWKVDRTEHSSPTFPTGFALFLLSHDMRDESRAASSRFSCNNPPISLFNLRHEKEKP